MQRIKKIKESWMTEHNNDVSPKASPTLAEPTLKSKYHWLPSVVWIVPLIALLVGGTLLFQAINSRGPEITISFKTAEGLEAGKTKLKYKDVNIGQVEAVTLSPDRATILAKVLLNKDAGVFTAKDTHFWVVKPRLDSSGVSGLSTLLSGAYIAADAGQSKEYIDQFIGLETQPIVTRDDSGKQFILHAKDIGSLDIGSPVFYRRIKVGRVAAFNLDEDGRGVNLRIFVDDPYTKFIGSNTRFWHDSGVDLELNANGLKLNTQSLLTLAIGGLAFESIADNPGPLSHENTAFSLAEDKIHAFKEPEGLVETVMLYFDHSIRGLTPGALVDFRGVDIGEVKSVGIEYDQTKQVFHMPVVIEVYPERLGRDFNQDHGGLNNNQTRRLQKMVQRGLRAQLRTGNLLTSQKYIAFDFFPNAPQVALTQNHEFNVIPTIPGSLDALQSQLEHIVKEMDKVPFGKIGNDLQKTLTTMNTTLTNAGQLANSLNQDVVPEVRAAMIDVRKTLNNADHTLAAADKTFSSAQSTLSEDSAMQQDLRETFKSLSRAATSLKVLTDYLEQHPESLLRGKPADPTPQGN
jgi:paraquat-inducible protein B